MTTDDVFVRLRQHLPTLRPHERRIAEAALADPDGVARMTIDGLAAHCSTSTATVARLCKSVGFSGYKDFCLSLTRASSSESDRLQAFGVSDGDIDLGDSTAEIVHKLAFHEAQAVQETAQMLNLDDVDRVVDALVTAPFIDIYGSASSGLAAADLGQKLRRIGYLTGTWSDIHLALTSAAVLPAGAVAIAFSHSGETDDAVSTLETAKESGAFTVAVTNFPESTLAQKADAVLTTVSRETRFRYGAMSSRMAQLMIVDIIFMSVAMRNPTAVTAALTATFAAVEPRRHTRRTSREARPGN